MYRIFVLYALSGFVSLGYQVAWFRIFNDWFGSTTLTFALVVCNFIGGLGLGALYSQPIADWIGARCKLDDRIRIYGVVEMLVGLTVLLTMLFPLLPGDIWGGFPYVETAEGFWQPSLAMSAVQIGAAIICVLIPCLFMGVTFPLICHAFINASRSAQLPSSLYAWNTLGACAGVLACQYLLLPGIGHGPTFWLMAFVNILLGAYFWLTGGAAPVTAVATEATAKRPVDSDAGPMTPRVASAAPGALITFAMLSGLVAGALEGDMFKRIAFAIQGNPGATMSFISFWAILGIFLASVTVRRVAGLRIGLIKVAFLAAFIYYAAISQLPVIDELMAWAQTNVFPVPVPEFLPFEFSGSLSFPNNLTQLLVFVGIIVFPPFYLISLLLPFVCNRAQADGRHLGRIYGLNTLAFCVGLVGFTLLAPQLNIFYSTKLFYVLFALATLYLLLQSERRRPAAWQPAGFAAAFAVGCFLVPADFDRHYFHPQSPSATSPISALRSNSNVTTYIASLPGMEILYFGRLNMTGTNLRAQAYMRLMAHFPLLAQETPKKALLICFGVGNTGSAIVAHDSIEALDVVDLNENVFRTASEFEKYNHGVARDSRTRLINDDGRHFLRVTDDRYDLITSEPPPPMAAGIYRLYSREYYQDALEHLTPGGMMSQWLPIYQMPEAAVNQAVQTFTEVFPHTLLFSGWGNDFILVGSPSPIDLERLERNFATMSKRTAADLQQALARDDISLLARIIDSDAGLRARYRASRSISDQRNDLEQMLLTPAPREGLQYRPTALYEELGLSELKASGELFAVMTHLGRLRYRASGFPYESMATVVDDGTVSLAGTDWGKVRRLYDGSLQALGTRQIVPAMKMLQEGLAIANEQPQLLFDLAKMQRRQRNFSGAEQSLSEFVRLEPGDFEGRYLLALTQRDRGNSSAALQTLATAAELSPDAPGPLNDIAWILATHPDESIRDPARAVAAGERAVELDGKNNPGILDTLAAAYAAAGDFAAARATAQVAIDTLHESGTVNPGVVKRLAGYEANQAYIDAALKPG